ncbi:hypothetical protein ANN_04446 [Periplaneta americana]|uniref:Uncharacterized protein n=1 Tax=Periplaneta americana TaxID=6978 RepID=A0ABQ8T9B7_PERAM|nr:hypothetical protein ANN_04446 [Periplaneta americana]
MLAGSEFQSLGRAIVKEDEYEEVRWDGKVVLYGCVTWTLTLKEELRLRIFENKMPRKIFGIRRDKVTGEWRKSHNAELHALYPSPNIIRNFKFRRLRWTGHVERMGESRNAYRDSSTRHTCVTIVQRAVRTKDCKMREVRNCSFHGKFREENMAQARESINCGFPLRRQRKDSEQTIEITRKSEYPEKAVVFPGKRACPTEVVNSGWIDYGLNPRSLAYKPSVIVLSQCSGCSNVNNNVWRTHHADHMVN